MIKRITNPDIAIFGGVIAGFAFRLGIPTWILRALFIIFIVFSHLTGIVIYLILWVLMPSQYLHKEEFDVGVGQHPQDNSITPEVITKTEENKDLK